MIVGDEDGASADQCQQLVDPELLSNDNIHNITLGYLSSTQVDPPKVSQSLPGASPLRILTSS